MLLLYRDVPLRPYIIFLASIVGGMIATNTDSIFGATIQAKYRCLNCKKYLEKRMIHCNFLTVQEKGIGRIDNNVVNFLSAILGAQSLPALLSFTDEYFLQNFLIYVVNISRESIDRPLKYLYYQIYIFVTLFCSTIIDTEKNRIIRKLITNMSLSPMN